MATSKDYINFIMEQLSALGDIKARQMMGEYIIYYRGKIAAYVCDNRLLVKLVPAAEKYLPIGITGVSMCTQRISDLMAVPTVTVFDDKGNPMEVSYDPESRTFTEQTKSNTISDEEKDRIKKAQDAYSLAEGLVDKYAAKLRSAQDETQKRAGAVKPQGAFYAKAASALRGNMMEQRMFMATQEIEKHTKKAAELLKDMGGGNTQTFQ